MKYQAILWDLDGTLLNTIADLASSVNAALLANGLPKRTESEIAAFTGNGIRRLVEQAVPEGCAPDKLECTYAAFCTHYEAHCRDTTRPYEGIVPLLRQFQAAGGVSAIVSNKAEFAVKQLAAAQFPDTVALAIGATAQRQKKPAPDMVEAALSVLAVPRERVLYIGDSEVDIATAAATSLDSVIVTWGFRSRETLLACGARRLVDKPEELWEILTGETEK